MPAIGIIFVLCCPLLFGSEAAQSDLLPSSRTNLK